MDIQLKMALKRLPVYPSGSTMSNAALRQTGGLMSYAPPEFTRARLAEHMRISVWAVMKGQALLCVSAQLRMNQSVLKSLPCRNAKQTVLYHRKAVKYSLFLAGYQGLVSRRMIGENSGFAAYAVK